MQVTKKALVLGAVGITAVVALATAGTLAAFQSTPTPSGGNTFSTGAISLTTDMPTAALTYTSGGGMMPGTTVYRTVVVSNAAAANATNEDLRYALTVTTTGTAALANALQLTIQAGDTAGAHNTCTAHDGAILYLTTGPGPLNGTAGAATNANNEKLIGDPAQGAQPGDRPLAHNTSETLCFTVTLPVSADNSVAGASTTATFAFIAEQTLNNT